jgi:hypothetical protein
LAVVLNVAFQVAESYFVSNNEAEMII